jgi:hypothetical protein
MTVLLFYCAVVDNVGAFFIVSVSHVAFCGGLSHHGSCHNCRCKQQLWWKHAHNMRRRRGLTFCLIFNCLFGTQNYHQMHDHVSTISGKSCYAFEWPHHHYSNWFRAFKLAHGSGSVYLRWRTEGYWSTLFSKLEFSDLPGMLSIFQVPSLCSTVMRVAYEWEHVWEDLICPCVGSEANTNPSCRQKELLRWHWKLGVGMQQIQEMMRENKAIDVLPPVLTPTFTSMPNCPIPMCRSCELAHQKRCSPWVKQSHIIPKKEALLSRDQYEAGDFVSADQFFVNTPGWLSRISSKLVQMSKEKSDKEKTSHHWFWD